MSVVNPKFDLWTNKPSDNNTKPLAIKYGTNLPITGVSLNEAQQIQNELRENALRSLYYPDTYATYKASMQLEASTSPLGYTVKFSCEQGGSLFLVFSNGKSISLNKKDVDSLVTLPGQFMSLVTSEPKKSLVMEYTEHDYDYEDIIKNFYGAGAVVEQNYLYDSRYGFETNRRRIPKVNFRTVQATSKEIKDFLNGKTSTAFSGYTAGTEYFIIATYEYRNSEWKQTYRCNLAPEQVTVDFKNNLGHYTITSISTMLSEFRLNFPVQSIRFGYYRLAIDGVPYTDGVPVNQPIRTSPHIFDNLSRISVVFYDLRDISSNMWGAFLGQSWESLLNQKWFEVTDVSKISLELKINSITTIENVKYGTLKLYE